MTHRYVSDVLAVHPRYRRSKRAYLWIMNSTTSTISVISIDCAFIDSIHLEIQQFLHCIATHDDTTTKIHHYLWLHCVEESDSVIVRWRSDLYKVCRRNVQMRQNVNIYALNSCQGWHSKRYASIKLPMFYNVKSSMVLQICSLKRVTRCTLDTKYWTNHSFASVFLWIFWTMGLHTAILVERLSNVILVIRITW